MKVESSWISYFSSKAQREGAINLAQGRPGFSPPKKLLEILKTLIEKNDLHQYAPGKGDFCLIEEILNLYRKFNENLKKENILIVQGATEGIFLSFLYISRKFSNPSILTFDPYYESYPRLAKILGIPINYIEISPFELNFERKKLKDLIYKKNIKAIVLSSPSNPLGKIFNQEEISFLLNLIKEKNGFLVFDGVYENIYFNLKPYNPLCKDLKNLIFISSFSKTLSITGWRIGYIITNEKDLKNISSIHDWTGLSAPFIFQRAISNYLKEKELENYLKKLKNDLKISYEFLENELEKSQLKLAKLEGGIFAWIKLPSKFKTALDFAKNLFELKKVAVVPGINFSKKNQNFFRINLSLSFEEFKLGIRKLKEFLNEF